MKLPQPVPKHETAQSQAVPRTFCGLLPSRACSTEERKGCSMRGLRADGGLHASGRHSSSPLVQACSPHLPPSLVMGAGARSCTGATPGINTGWGMKGLRAALPRRTWGCWWMKSWTWASNARSQPRRPTVSWAASKAAWPAGWGRGFCPSALLWWDPTAFIESTAQAMCCSEREKRTSSSRTDQMLFMKVL